MDQWRSKFSESFSLDRYWSIEYSSLIHAHRSHGTLLLLVGGAVPVLNDVLVAIVIVV